MRSIPRSMNDRTSSIRMSPSSLRLARPMRSRSTAMASITPERRVALRDRRSGLQHLVLRPVGGRAPGVTPTEDIHCLGIVLELGHHAVERGEILVIAFENDVVEVARERSPGSQLRKTEPAPGCIDLRDPGQCVAILAQLSDHVHAVTNHWRDPPRPPLESCAARPGGGRPDDSPPMLKGFLTGPAG